MADQRIKNSIKRGRSFYVNVDGEKIVAHEGETIAAVMIAAGKKVCNTSSKNKTDRGVYCGIGMCFNCLMVINGVPNTRSCQTLATPGARIETQQGLGWVRGDFEQD